MARYSTILTISLTLLLFSSARAKEAYGEYHPDRLVLRLNKSAGSITPYQTNQGWRFGLGELDAICEQYQVSRIAKLFPWAQPPQDTRLIDLSRVFVLFFQQTTDLEEILQACNASGYVEYAEPEYIRHLFYTPNDPDFYQQWGLDNNHTQAELAFDYCQGDPAVSISIVDTGMDMYHPDLYGNLWVNPGEDLNGNGVVDPEEQNGVDDDNDGFVDDFWGWDFVGNDNWPNDDTPWWLFGGHGTHCAGIASAQTDNGTGIASLGFAARLVPVRVGFSLFVLYPYEGVGYAIAAGADIISMSWGGGGYSQTEQDLFNLANQLGITCIAAAGNSNNSNPMYPAAYDNVMAVAATDEGDYKAGFSSYGYWVDISAPGTNIYSTFLGGGYTTMDGTSMACPFTASLAGLVKAAYPAFTTDEIQLVISLSADDISAQNPGYIGQLGAGRINAYKAMSMLMYDVSLTLAPQSPAIQIPPGGGSFLYDEVIDNNSSTSYTISINTQAILPNGNVYQISSQGNVNLPAGGSLVYSELNQNVPDRAPSGTYSYVVYISDESSGNLMAMDSFTFDKLPGNGGSEGIAGWALSGSERGNLQFAKANPAEFALLRAYPNPFNPTAHIAYTLPEGSVVKLAVYDIQGKEVARLVDEWRPAGLNKATFDASYLPSGIYLVRLATRGYQLVQKLLLVK